MNDLQQQRKLLEELKKKELHKLRYLCAQHRVNQGYAVCYGCLKLCVRLDMEQLATGTSLCPHCQVKALHQEQLKLQNDSEWRPTAWHQEVLKQHAKKVITAAKQSSWTDSQLDGEIKTVSTIAARFEWWLARHLATEEYRMYKRLHLRLLRQLRQDQIDAHKNGTSTRLQYELLYGRWLSSRKICLICEGDDVQNH